LEQGRLYFAFYNLGFIIVDEEHEQTFKQVDPHRGIMQDAAIVLAQSHQAKVLLGSLSIETYFNANQINLV
jgi:primosomal protein N' (replication factor Y)